MFVHAVAVALAIIALLGGVSALLGWLGGFPRLTDWDGDGVAMLPNTSALMSAGGASLLILLLTTRTGAWLWIARGLAGLITAVAALNLVQLVLGINLGIDTLLVNPAWGSALTVSPGRMGPPATITLMLLGTALLLATDRRPMPRRVASWLALVATIPPLVAWTAYFYDAAPLYALPNITAIAQQTAGLLFCLAVGIVLAIDDRGLGALVRRDDTGGAMVRRLLPLSLLFLMVSGWLTDLGEKRGLYSSAFGNALLTTTRVIIFTALLWWTAKALSQHVASRRRAEAALGESEQRFRVMADSAPVLIRLCGADHRCTWFNRQWLEFVGCDLPGELGEGWMRHVHPEDLEAGRTSISAAIRKGVPFSVEFRLRRADGEYRWMLDHGVPLSGGPAETVGYVCSSVDITDRKEFEQALHQRELAAKAAAEANAKFQAFFDQGSYFAGVMSVDGTMLEANRLCLEGCGYKREDVIGRKFWECGWWSPDPTLREMVREGTRIAASGEVFRRQSTYYISTGQVRHTELIISPVKDGDGNVLFLAPTGTDITDRVEAVERLLRNEEQFRSLADSIPQLAWTARADGWIDWYNRRWYEYTGTTPSQMEGWGWQSVHDPDVLPEVMQRWTASVASGEPFDMVFPLRGADGVFRPFLTRVIPVRDSSGTVVRWFGTNTDISEQRAVQDALRQANRMKDEFLATLSHELRTPMAAILGWVQMLRRVDTGTSPVSPEEVRRGLQIIERNARLQSQIIEDLLDMNRILSGKVRLDVQTVRLAAIVEAAVSSIRPAAEAKGIRLESVCDPINHDVRGDPNRLQQVIYNLLSNAVKFTPSGGKVQVACQRVNSHVEISVSDTGVGIKPEFLPHVFERFRQQDASITRSYGGLGLGLGIVKHLVELHGGRVQVASDGESRGSTFVVHLPVSIAVLPQSAQSPDGQERVHPASTWVHDPDQLPARSDRLGGIKALIVDDEPDARDLLRHLLQCHGAQAVVAASADEALVLLQRERPHILLSDIGMPGTDGYQLIARVRKLPPEQGGRIPAIALTAFARSEDRTRSLQAGFNIHLSKPVEMAELLASVVNVLGGSIPKG